MTREILCLQNQSSAVLIGAAAVNVKSTPTQRSNRRNSKFAIVAVLLAWLYCAAQTQIAAQNKIEPGNKPADQTIDQAAEIYTQNNFFYPELLLPRERNVNNFDLVATFFGAMPTGVTVSQESRVFVCFPRSMDDLPQVTVAEVRSNGNIVPYPNAAINLLDTARPTETFVSIQSVVVDPRNRLWVLDVGRVGMNPVIPGGAKLVGIDLNTNRVFKTIVFPQAVAPPNSSINDVRFDLRRGADGAAYITDSSDTGSNAIIVVDLATGNSFRRLNDHPSTKAEPEFLPFVEGRELRQRLPGQAPQYIKTGADGIAISNDGARLFYSPLASRRLYSVSTDALLNQNLTDAQVAATIQSEPKAASDGLESDAEGRIYATAYEHNGIVRRRLDGTYETLLFDPRVLWADTLSLAGNGYLYLINNQLHRQPRFNSGVDRRDRPYSLLRIRVNATPVRLQ